MHLDLVFVDRAHRAEARSSRRPGPAARRRRPRRRTACAAWASENGSVPSADGQEDREDDHADAVVEQAFAGDRRLQRRRHVRARRSTPITATGSVGLISAPNTRHQMSGTSRPTSMAEQIEAAADQRGREQHADRAEHQDRPAPAPHLAPVDMQRAGEQQERQHAVHQRRVEIDAGDEPDDVARRRRSPAAAGRSRPRSARRPRPSRSGRPTAAA